MKKNAIILSILLACLCSASTVRAEDNVATTVVSSSGLGTNHLYDNPAAALGEPTTQYVDGSSTYETSMVAAPYNVSPSGADVLVSLGSTGTETVELSSPIVHSNSHWYGDDFIVYGNSFFGVTGSSPAISSTVNMSDVDLASGIYQNGIPEISVSEDGISWVTLTATNSLTASGEFDPTNAYSWDSATDSWGSLNNFSEPVNPDLTLADFTGQTVAYADDTLYDGAAGGAAFTLAGSGLSEINYIRFTGDGSGGSNNIDAVVAVSDASAAPEPSEIGVLLIITAGLAGLILRARRRVS